VQNEGVNPEIHERLWPAQALPLHGAAISARAGQELLEIEKERNGEDCQKGWEGESG